MSEQILPSVCPECGGEVMTHNIVPNSIGINCKDCSWAEKYPKHAVELLRDALVEVAGDDRVDHKGLAEWVEKTKKYMDEPVPVYDGIAYVEIDTSKMEFGYKLVPTHDGRLICPGCLRFYENDNKIPLSHCGLCEPSERVPRTIKDGCWYALVLRASEGEWVCFYEFATLRWKDITTHGDTKEEAIERMRQRLEILIPESLR